MRSLLSPLLLPILVTASCQEGAEPAEAPGTATAEAGEQEPAGNLWELPPVPWPVHVEVDGMAVAEVHVHSFLEKEWQEYHEAGAADPATRSAGDFLADPDALFRPFARDLILLSEGTARWPELDPREVAHFRAKLIGANATAWQAIVDRWGEEAAQHHLESRLRIERMMELIADSAPEVTEEQVRSFYETYRAEKGEHPEFGFPPLEQLRPTIEARLRGERRDAAVQAWLDQHFDEHRVELELPGGRQITFGD